MRLTLLVALILAAIGGTYYFVQDTNSNFQAAFIAVAEQHPEAINAYAVKAVDNCIAVDTGRSISQNVKAVASASMVRTMLLVAKGKTQEEVSDDMIVWATKRVKSLTKSEQRQYFHITPILIDSEASLCIMEKLMDSKEFWLQHGAISWEIRS